MIRPRKEIRDERAEKVCREVRYQMANHGGILDNNILVKLLESWMKVAKKNKYKRP